VWGCVCVYACARVFMCPCALCVPHRQTEGSVIAQGSQPIGPYDRQTDRQRESGQAEFAATWFKQALGCSVQALPGASPPSGEGAQTKMCVPPESRREGGRGWRGGDQLLPKVCFPLARGCGITNLNLQPMCVSNNRQGCSVQASTKNREAPLLPPSRNVQTLPTPVREQTCKQALYSLHSYLVHETWMCTSTHAHSLPPPPPTHTRSPTHPPTHPPTHTLPRCPGFGYVSINVEAHTGVAVWVA
jgi:hypothetical protein